MLHYAPSVGLASKPAQLVWLRHYALLTCKRNRGKYIWNCPAPQEQGNALRATSVVLLVANPARNDYTACTTVTAQSIWRTPQHLAAAMLHYASGVASQLIPLGTLNRAQGTALS
eukprot:COSAG02_NODE_32515_length_515_cov_0.723558_1_plen_114_part_10